MTTLAGTGHRPVRLGLDYGPESDALLRDFLKRHVEVVQGMITIDRVLVGMAAGFDMALGEAAIELGLPLVAVLPYVDAYGSGMEKHWPVESRDRFHRIIAAAEKVEVMYRGPSRDYGKYLARDRWMVEHADVLLTLYDGGGRNAFSDPPVGGGTSYTVDYAKEIGIPVINLYRSWVEHQVEAPR